MQKQLSTGALAAIALLVLLGSNFGATRSTAEPIPKAEPIALQGEYYFYAILEADDGPVCAERRWFKDDGTEIEASGEEIVVKRFRVETANFGATLYENIVSTNGKPDCLADRNPTYATSEQHYGLYRAQDGGIVLTRPKALPGGMLVSELVGRYVQSQDGMPPPSDPNAVVPPPPARPPTATVMSGTFPGVFQHPVPRGAAHECLGYYPPDAENASRSGVTLLTFKIEADGSVAAVKINKSSGRANLDEAAMACVKQWHYAPIQVSGKPVAVSWIGKVTWRSDTDNTPYQTALRQDSWKCLWLSAAANSLPPQFSAWVDVHILFSTPSTSHKVEISTSSGDQSLDAAALECVRHSPSLAAFEMSKSNTVGGDIRLAFWRPGALVTVVPDNLFDAAKTGDVTKAKALIAAGADVNAKDDTGETTPLDWAARKNHLDVMELLLAHGADVRARDFYGFTPLHHAASWGSKEGVELLLARGADANDSKNGAGQAPIHYAVGVGHEDIISVLLDHGADINARDGQEKTPLHLAVELTNRGFAGGQEATTKGPAEGANKSSSVSTSETLADAVSELTAFLLAHKADVNARDKWNNTPLHGAAWSGFSQGVELLLAHGADVNARNIGGDTPLKNAEKREHDDIAALLRQHGGHE